MSDRTNALVTRSDIMVKTKAGNLGAANTSEPLVNPLILVGNRLMNILPGNDDHDRLVDRKETADRLQEMLLDKDELLEVVEHFTAKALEEDKVWADDPDSASVYKVIFDGLAHYNAASIFRFCESPIETMFFSSLLLHSARCLQPIVIVPRSKNVPQEIRNATDLIEFVQSNQEKFVDFMFQHGKDDPKKGMPDDFGYGGVLYSLLAGSGEDLSGVIHIFIQAGLPNVGKGIRVDALAWLPKKKRQVVIECDGFKFHSSSKAFISDRQRDRKLQSKGYKILRFSGSEIVGNPVKTPIEFVNFMLQVEG